MKGHIMTETSARFALPHIMPGQAQKEAFHNEALTLIDAALHPVAETLGDNVPPAAPQPGQCWIVGASPTGAWSGQAGKLAAWTDGGWRFVAPPEGMRVALRGTGLAAIRTASGWEQGVVRASSVAIGGVQVVGARQPAIASAVSGNEVRDALNAALAALRAHGLIAS